MITIEYFEHFSSIPTIFKDAIRYRLILPDGEMLPKARLHNCPCILIFKNGLLVGWTALTGKNEPEMLIFVDKNHRREGIGTILAEEASKRVTEPKVWAWDGPSLLFYNNIKEKITLKMRYYNGMESQNLGTDSVL